MAALERLPRPGHRIPLEATRAEAEDRPHVFWIKEFGAAAAPGPAGAAAEDSTTRQRLAVIAREFLDNAYIFGVALASRRGIHPCDRALWIVVILAASVVTVCQLPQTYLQATQHPTSVEVRTTAKSLFNIPFPSVTVCPKMKVRKRVAIDYLKQANKLTYLNESLVLPALKFLEEFKLPYWLDLRPDPIIDDEVSDLFAGIDIRDFMNTVAQNCSSVFRGCFWAGVEVDCCKLFSRTVSDRGMCFAFNSFTTLDRRSACKLIPVEEQPTVSSASMWYLNRPKTEQCGLYNALGAGLYSALEVFLNFADPLDMVGTGVHSRGYDVAVQAANENPDMGRGLVIAEATNVMTTASVTYQETGADPWLRSLHPDARSCLFEDELPELFQALDQNWYTQDACITICRYLFLYKRCNCYPFLISAAKQCSLEEYLCIVKNGRESLLWARVTTEDLPGTTPEERNHSAWPDCRACMPLCSQSVYKTAYRTAPSVHVPSHGAAAFLNVFFRDLHSAVKYTEVRDQDPADQFVTYCSVINLFLGLSVLSLAQVAFYLARVLAELWGPACRRLAQLRDRCWRPRTPPAGTPPAGTPPPTPPNTQPGPNLDASGVPLPFVI